VQRRTLELWTGEAVVETVRAARTTGREETEAVKAAVKAVVATVSARRALTTLHMTTLRNTCTARFVRTRGMLIPRATPPPPSDKI
jgi:hypothetical protein